MTTLTRWRPLAEPGLAPRDMGQFFDRFFGRGDWQTEEATVPAFYPHIDVIETPENVLVHVEIPGMEAKDLDISIQENVLTVKGEKNIERTEGQGTVFHRVERSHGTFTRSFRLPTTVLVDKVAADYKHGVLEITLPKSDDSKRREVKIKVS